MNRQQRRQANKTAQKNQAGPAQVERLKNEALRLRQNGKNAEAIPLMIEALRLDNGLADIHFALSAIARAAPSQQLSMDMVNKLVKNKVKLVESYRSILEVLRVRKQYAEAALCQEEICKLQPGNPEDLINLSLLLNTAGRNEEATEVIAKALNAHPEHTQIKNVFTTLGVNVVFSRFNPEVKDAILKLFENIYDLDLLRMYGTWVNLMIVDPEFQILRRRETLESHHFVEWMDSLDEKALSFLRSPYFLGGIRLLIIADPMMESLLTNLRRYLCLNYNSLQSDTRIAFFEPFLYSMAVQCYYNEYVFPLGPDEEKIIQDIISKSSLTPQDLGLIGCYHSLHSILSDKQKKSALEHPSSDLLFAELIKTQLRDPETESKLRATMPAFGAIANLVSQSVQQQYEENPYPRWTTVKITPSVVDDLPIPQQDRYKPYNILIAGCGTGRQALGSAGRYPNASITAIDLSRASLSYAKRKAQESGLDRRIKFVHADILSMKDWDDSFDIIECSGVLHHMQDPFLGWQTLVNKLKPGGFFKVGLYSETGRIQTVAAQNFVKSGNYPATTKGIRDARQDFLKLPTTNPMRQKLVVSNDFYTTSLVRDLLFHVQEHRMTLPQIKDMLATLNLQCTRFTVSVLDTAIQYDKMFPDDTDRKNLDHWNAFEKQHPDAFAGMYQFWARKAI